MAVCCGTEERTKWRNLSRFLFSNEDIVIDKFVTYSDGEFYMDFTTDFLKYFGKLYIVHLNPIRMEFNEKKRARQSRRTVKTTRTVYRAKKRIHSSRRRTSTRWSSL